MQRFITFLKSKNGVTSIQYALLALLIALVILFAIKGLGLQVSNVYGNVSTKLR